MAVKKLRMKKMVEVGAPDNNNASKCRALKNTIEMKSRIIKKPIILMQVEERAVYVR